jgi:hypothetical protein
MQVRGSMPVSQAVPDAGAALAQKSHIFLCAAFVLLILIDLFMAERVGFEPTVLVKVHTLSKRAP